MAERVILIPAEVDRTAVLGPADRNLKVIRETLGVALSPRDGQVLIRGDHDEVTRASAVMDMLIGASRARRAVSREELLEAILAQPGERRRARAGDDDGWGDPSGRGEPGWEGQMTSTSAGRTIKPKTPNQEDYLEAIRTHDLVLSVGPAGTGKTYLAVAAAVHMLRSGRVKRLILARPAVEAGERLGFLPGDLQQKVNPYLRPLLDALEEMLDYQTLQRFMANDVIEVIPLAFMRGRTLNDAVIILDEAQNTTAGQMLMFLTRMGRRSKCVVTGDPSQVDLPPSERSGLLDALERLRGVPGIAFARLDESDIVRHRLVQRIVEAYRTTDEQNLHLRPPDQSMGKNPPTPPALPAPDSNSTSSP